MRDVLFIKWFIHYGEWISIVHYRSLNHFFYFCCQVSLLQIAKQKHESQSTKIFLQIHFMIINKTEMNLAHDWMNHWLKHRSYMESGFESVILSVTWEIHSSVFQQISFGLCESFSDNQDSLNSHGVNQCLTQWIFRSGLRFLLICSAVQDLNQWIFWSCRFSHFSLSKSVFESVNLLLSTMIHPHFLIGSGFESVNLSATIKIHSFTIQRISIWVNESFRSFLSHSTD